MPLPVNLSNRSPQVEIELGGTQTPPSPTSSYEEITYSNNSWSSNPHNSNRNTYNTQYHVDDELPLHNMEPRRRNVGLDPSIANAPGGGWAPDDPYAPTQGKYYPPTSYAPSIRDGDGKGVYEKERMGYATGKLPPRQRRPPQSAVSG